MSNGCMSMLGRAPRCFSEYMHWTWVSLQWILARTLTLACIPRFSLRDGWTPLIQMATEPCLSLEEKQWGLLLRVKMGFIEYGGPGIPALICCRRICSHWCSCLTAQTLDALARQDLTSSPLAVSATLFSRFAWIDAMWSTGSQFLRNPFLAPGPPARLPALFLPALI